MSIHLYVFDYNIIIIMTIIIQVIIINYKYYSNNACLLSCQILV